MLVQGFKNSEWDKEDSGSAASILIFFQTVHCFKNSIGFDNVTGVQFEIKEYSFTKTYYNFSHSLHGANICVELIKCHFNSWHVYNNRLLKYKLNG